MPTINEVISQALNLIRVTKPGQGISPEMLAAGLVEFNSLKDSLNAEKGVIYRVRYEAFPLTSNVSAYTIGPTSSSPTWSVGTEKRPIRIYSAVYRDNQNASVPVDYPLQVLSGTQYTDNALKANTGTTWAVYYDPAFPKGTVYVIGKPVNAGDQLVLGLATELVGPTGDDFVSGESVTYPRAYETLLRYGLAIRLAAIYPQAVLSEMVVREHVKAQARIAASNSNPVYFDMSEVRFMQTEVPFGLVEWV